MMLMMGKGHGLADAGGKVKARSFPRFVFFPLSKAVFIGCSFGNVRKCILLQPIDNDLVLKECSKCYMKILLCLVENIILWLKHFYFTFHYELFRAVSLLTIYENIITGYLIARSSFHSPMEACGPIFTPLYSPE